MSLCASCLSLDLASVLRRLQPKNRVEDNISSWVRRRDIDVIPVPGWHAHGRDVFASAAACKVCSLVTSGWRGERSRVVLASIEDKMFGPHQVPEDLYTEINEMPIYQAGRIEVEACLRERMDDGRQALSCFLRFSCQTSGMSWKVQDSLDTELRIALDAREVADMEASLSVRTSIKLQLDNRVANDPLCSRAVDVARTWLHTCQDKHKICATNSRSFLPSRYLDVGDEACNRIYLREQDTAAMPASDGEARYVALSHCWGSTQTFCTNTSTIDNHKAGIDLTELPQTFKDSVDVVRQLGLRYLWIDSLCIIQDDLDDWRAESAQMADVYRCAFLVLGAGRSAADVDGFLGPRQDYDVAPLRVSEEEEPLYLQLQPPRTTPWRRWVNRFRELGEEPLGKRAWCLQERYLARRMLTYNSTQMLWECCEMRATEKGDSERQSGDPLSRIVQTAGVEPSVFTRGSNDDWSGLGDSGFTYVDWYTMVEEYTSRAISRDSDRLPALLGLANALQERTGDTYLIGIWLRGLLEGLMWCKAQSTNALMRPKDCITPSWSWVSVKGAIEFPIYSWHERRAAWKGSKCTFEPLAIYCGHDIEKPKLKKQGTTIQGQLRLVAPLVKVLESRLKAETPTVDYGAREIVPDPSTVTDHTFCCEYASGPAMRYFWVDGAFDTEHDATTRPLFVAFLSRLPFIVPFEFVEHRFGLLLTKDHDRDAYRRVGFVDSCILEPRWPIARDCVATLFSGRKELNMRVYQGKHSEEDMDSGELNRLVSDPLKLETTSITLV